MDLKIDLPNGMIVYQKYDLELIATNKRLNYIYIKNLDFLAWSFLNSKWIIIDEIDIT